MFVNFNPTEVRDKKRHVVQETSLRKFVINLQFKDKRNLYAYIKIKAYYHNFPRELNIVLKLRY